MRRRRRSVDAKSTTNRNYCGTGMSLLGNGVHEGLGFHALLLLFLLLLSSLLFCNHATLRLLLFCSERAQPKHAGDWFPLRLRLL